jgi:Na+/proline symporter
MSLLALVPAALCLGLCLIPAWLLRRAKYVRAQDYFIASEHTPTAVIQNSAVACTLWMAALGPFFGWGATGNFWASLVAAVCFPLGLSLMFCVRAPLLEYINDALIHDRSATIHQFIAQRHGNDSRLRLLAAALTVVASATLATGLAFALARSLAAGLDAAVPTSVLALCMLIPAAGCALIAGNSGILRSTQLQLGMIYFGLIGAAALLLYELISDLTQLPPYGIFGIVFVAAFCAVLVGYRRSRYVDTSPIRKTTTDPAAAGREPLSERLLVRFEKILNVCISILAVFAVVVAVMGLSAIGWSNVVRDLVAAIGRGADISGLALVAVCLLLLFYPLIDSTNWQRIAAMEKSAAERASPAEARSAGLLRLFRQQGSECAMVFAFAAALGGLAVATMGPSSLTSGLDDVFQQLAAGQNLVALIAAAFLLIGLLAIVLSSMSALLSSSLCALRYDIVPLLIARPQSTGSPLTDDASMRWRSVVLGGGIYLIVFGVAVAAEALQVRSTNTAALLFAVAGTQLSYVPLVVAPIIGATGRRFGPVSRGWAMTIISAGFLVTVSAVALSLGTADEGWLWAATPVNLGLSILLFALGKTCDAPAHRRDRQPNP